MNEMEELDLDGIFDVEDLGDENSTTEIRKMEWIFELYLDGEVPEKYRNNLAEFCKQFHTPEFAPGNIFLMGITTLLLLLIEAKNFQIGKVVKKRSNLRWNC